MDRRFLSVAPSQPGARLTLGGFFGGLGDTTTGAQVLAAGNQLQQMISSAPAALQAQLKALLARPATYGPPQTVAGAIAWYSQSNVGKGSGPYTDRDYALVAGALADAKTILSTGTAPTTPTAGANVQQIRSLTATMKGLLAKVSPSATSQANAILARQTSSPVATPNTIMAFYATANGSNYADRDYNLLAQAVADMQALVAGGGTPVSLPPAQTYQAPPPPTSAPAPANVAPSFSAPAPPNPFSLLPPLPSVPSFDPSTLTSLTGYSGASAPFGATPAPPAPSPSFFSGTIVLPVVGAVSTPVVLGALAAVGYVVVRRLKR